jgi:hypothetical protein
LCDRSGALSKEEIKESRGWSDGDRGRGGDLTGAGFLAKALSHKSLRFPASYLVKPLHCKDLLGFARGKPTPVRRGRWGEGEMQRVGDKNMPNAFSLFLPSSSFFPLPDDGRSDG